MKILFISFLISLSICFPSPSLATYLELKPCIQVNTCAREEWDVSSLNQPFETFKKIIENTPRTKITQLDDHYIHVEVTSKWMKYVDDLEIAFFPENNYLQIRSESRVGESDMGVNSKRVRLLKSKLFEIDF